MNLFCSFLIYLCLSLDFKNIESTKLLLDNPGFDNSKAWLTESLPCAQQTVVFPRDYEAILPLPQQVNAAGFVLPTNGAIVLHQNGQIELGHNKQNTQECQHDKAKLKTPLKRSWYNPKDWIDVPKSLVRNTAVPDVDRIPCDNETVIINRNGPFTVDLENVQFLRLGQLYLTGTLITKDYLNYLLTTELGSLLFQNSDHVTVEYYRNDVCGCHSDASYLVNPVCQNLKAECAIPHCRDPVGPFGSCCAICGAVLKYQISKCKRELLKQARNLLSRKLIEHNLKEELDIEINFYNNNHGKFIQIIAVDRQEYNERSVQFLQYVSATEDWKKIFNSSQLLNEAYAGRYYNPHLTLVSICLIIFCILLVLFVTLIIFAHYQPDHRVLQVMPTWIYNVRNWQIFRIRPHIKFARFDPHNEQLVAVSGDEVMSDNLSLKSDATSIGYKKGDAAMSSFDNPMCEAGLDNLVSNENIVPMLETHSFADVIDTGKIEDLQDFEEIKLDTVSPAPK